MRGTLYTVADLAIWMRCERSEIERQIKEDGLPTLNLSGKERPKVKIVPRHLCEWLNARSSMDWTIHELVLDIDTALLNAAKQRAPKKREEVAAA
jgi:hypothetical protein